MQDDSYFSAESGYSTRCFYYALLFITIVTSLAAVLAPLTAPECDKPLQEHEHPSEGRRLIQGLEGGLEHAPNPSYQPDPCRWDRYLILLGMNKWEADTSRRIIMSIVLGSIIGVERRRPDRPAGIRTMAMVCLGSCVFTLGSMYAFIDGTMGWDASRVSAAIPSGVGFLGAASIWKGTKGTGADSVPEVHGLTTATSVWLSAAIGILVGGALYVPSLFTTFVGVVYLRFAPRLYDASDSDSSNSNDGDEEARSAVNSLTEPLDPDSAPDAGGSTPQPKVEPISRKSSIPAISVGQSKKNLKASAEIFA